MNDLKPPYTHYKVVKEALVFPAIQDGGTTFIHGVRSKTPKDDPDYFGFIRGGVNIVNESLRDVYIQENPIPKVLHGKYLYLGMIIGHFGHFIAEYSSRLWACKLFEDKVDGFIVLLQGNATVPLFVNEIYKHFNVDTTKIIAVDSLSIVDELIVPAPGVTLGSFPEDWYLEMLPEIIDLSLYRRADLPKKIIVSRKNYRFSGRIAGFDYFIKLFTENGFFELLPEKHSIKRQLEFICSAELIIWEEGSALFLTDLLPVFLTKSILIKRRLEEEFSTDKIFAKKVPNSLTYQGIEILENKRYKTRNKMSKLSNPEEFATFLVQEGIIKSDDFDCDYFLNEEALDITQFYLKEKLVHEKDSSESLSEKRLRAYVADIIKKKENLNKSKIHKKKITRVDYINKEVFEKIRYYGIGQPPKGTSTIGCHDDTLVRGAIVFSENNPEYSITVSDGNSEIECSKVPRPDIITRILNSDPADHEQLNCGFQVHVPWNWKNFNINLNFSGKKILLAAITIDKSDDC